MRTNDDVHKSIPYDPLIEAIVDTPQMQRLRALKQLGTSEMTYIATTHSRFEHSWGVMHLAEKLVKEIRRKQPKLGITDKDIACVKIAGLLHDLGHGPFSHVYDGMFRKKLRVAENKGEWLGQSFASKYYDGLPKQIDEWSHEDGSLMMIDALLAHLGLRIDESNLDAPLQQIGDGFKAETFGISRPTEVEQFIDVQSQEISDELPYDCVLTSRDWIFIKECIVGGPLPQKHMSVDKTSKSNLKQTLIGRPDPHKEFLYDVVSNRHSGLDVDKIDYLARDSRRAFGTNGEVDPMLFENAYVGWGQCGRPEKCWRCKHHYQRDVKPSADARHDMHLMICYPVSYFVQFVVIFLNKCNSQRFFLQTKMIQNAMNFFKSRFRNHEYLYTHHNTNAASYMICDILLLADPVLRLSTFYEGENSSRRDDVGGFESSLKLPISRAYLHPQSYLLLTDSILDVIAASDSPELKPARVLLNRYRSHMLYKKIAEKPISSSDDSKGFKYLWEEELWNMSDDEIANTILKMGRLENASFQVSEDDIIVEKRQIHHGKGVDNPVNGMRFLPKTMISKATEEYPEYLPDAIPISEDDYECCIPRAFLQRTLRIYCRNYDKDVQDFLTTCYHAFLMFVRKNSSGKVASGRDYSREDYQNEVSNHSTSRAVYLSQDSPMNEAWSNHSFNPSRNDEPASKKRKPLYRSLNIEFD
jgi:HD superfamily phosphohydrolase